MKFHVIADKEPKAAAIFAQSFGLILAENDGPTKTTSEASKTLTPNPMMLTNANFPNSLASSLVSFFAKTQNLFQK